MQSKPARARMCLKIWNGDFLSFAPFRGLQIELTSIVLLPIRKHGTILSSLVQQQLAIVGSIWLHPWKSLHRPGYFGGKWWTSQSGKLRGWHCGPTRLAFTVPWRCLKMDSSTHHATMLEGLPQHSPHSTKSDDSDVGWCGQLPIWLTDMAPTAN
jgi:hypothetical protein